MGHRNRGVRLARAGGVGARASQPGGCFIEARHLPRDLVPLIAGVVGAMARSRIVIGTECARTSARLTAMLARVTTVSIPPLSERRGEIARLLAAYGHDAVAALGAPGLNFRTDDRRWIRSNPSWITTLDELEDAARRLIALRTWGALRCPALGLSHGAPSRWARRRGIPT